MGFQIPAAAMVTVYARSYIVRSSFCLLHVFEYAEQESRVFVPLLDARRVNSHSFLVHLIGSPGIEMQCRHNRKYWPVHPDPPPPLNFFEGGGGGGGEWRLGSRVANLS